MTELDPEEMWVCDCDGRHQAAKCAHRRIISRRYGAPVRPVEPEPVALPILPGEAAGRVGPLERAVPVGSWPARARVLAPFVVEATRVSGRPAVGAPVVESLRLVGADWWAAWEDGRYHCGLTPSGLVTLSALVAYARGARKA